MRSSASFAIRPWSTYELAQLHDSGRCTSSGHARRATSTRSRSGSWRPAMATAGDRVERRPQAHDLLDHRDGPRGASRRWLATRRRPPQRLESEAALRLLFGNLGTKDDLHAARSSASRRMRRSLVEHLLRDLGDEYAPRRGALPRAHPRQRPAHHADGRAGPGGLALGDMGDGGGRALGRHGDAERRVGVDALRRVVERTSRSATRLDARAPSGASRPGRRGRGACRSAPCLGRPRSRPSRARP